MWTSEIVVFGTSGQWRLTAACVGGDWGSMGTWERVSHSQLRRVAKYTCAESTNSGGERNKRMWSLIPFTMTQWELYVAVCRCTIIIELQCLTSLKKPRSLVRRSRKEFQINASNEEGANQQTNAAQGYFYDTQRCPEEFVDRLHNTCFQYQISSALAFWF